MNNDDFSSLVLKPSERLYLFLLRIKKKAQLPDSMRYLYLHDLVKQNSSGKTDQLNAPIPDDTYSLTDKYYRYAIYRRDLFFKGKLPVILSAIALIKSFQDEILWLLQELAKLLK